MKKILTIILAVALIFTVCTPVMALATREVNTLNATATTSSVSVDGTVTPDVLAVIVEILDTDGTTSLAMKSFAVIDNSFTGNITGLNLTAGTTYTVRAANYDGGTWTTSTCKVPNPLPPYIPPVPPVVTYDIPVTGSENSLKASATVSNGAANISLDSTQLDNLLNDENTSGSITIDAGLDNNVDTAIIPTSVVNKVATAANDSEKAIDCFNLLTDNGEVELDATALAALSEQATGDTISFYMNEVEKTSLTTDQQSTIASKHADALVIEVTIKSDNVVVSSYNGGKITVTLPYTLKEGEIASGICVWHLASDGSLTLMECTYNEATQTVSFVTDHLSDFIVGFDSLAAWINPFIDVTNNSYFYSAVHWAVVNNITIGTSTTTFSPDDICTRAEMSEFLWRAAGSPEPTSSTNPFTDVSTKDYYYKAVLWAVEKKITFGTSSITFSPNETCTRGQMATFLYRYAGSPTVTGSNTFTDVAADDYYSDAVIWAATEKITYGDSATTFGPKTGCTRGQIVTFLYRLIEE